MSKKLVFVTGNANKLKEVKAILSQGGNPIEIDNQALDIPELQGTTQEIAIAKCRRAAELVNGPCITEDTALSFTALNGLPGPYIKDFMVNIGHEGLNKMLVGFNDTSAEAICTFAYSAGPGTEPIVFEGRTAGRIVPARGPKVFGWDAVFEPAGVVPEQTYAEMDPVEKNTISHRYKAFAQLRTFLQSQS